MIIGSYSDVGVSDNILIKPEDPEKKNIISQIDLALSKEDFAKAEELILKLKSISSDPEISVKLAHILFIEKKYKKAEQVYKEVLPSTDETLKVDVLFGLGQVYFESKMFSDCHMAFSVIANSFPNFKYILVVYLKLAKIMIHFQDLNNALQYLTKIFQANKGNSFIVSESFVILAYIREKQGKKGLALNIYQKAVKICKSFRTLSALALYLLESRPELTDKICQRALNKRTSVEEWSDICLIRALAFLKLKNFDQAVFLLEEQVRAFPLNYLYLEYLGIAYMKNKQKLKALEVFQRVRALYPTNLSNMRNLTLAYLRNGLKSDASHVNSAASFYMNGDMWDLNSLEITEPDMDIFTFPTNILSE